ncbi:MAG: amino acid transporter [Saprospiraceae bacterium]|nr:MAG: amino acid transporter [Saprospiraceae bacterium]
MLHLIFDGFKVGMILCFLLGPIFFALIQAGAEHGFRAGTMVGLGIWVSDFLFISCVYFGVSHVTRIIAWEHFTLTLGIVGSIILAIFGLSSLFSKPVVPDQQEMLPKGKDWLSFWLKGFLINTINPFTVFFWIGIMTTVVLEEHFNDTEASWYFGGILGTIILTDLCKVAFAKYLRGHLRIHHLLWLRRISGIALIIFGVALLVRVL